MDADAVLLYPAAGCRHPATRHANPGRGSDANARHGRAGSRSAERRCGAPSLLRRGLAPLGRRSRPTGWRDLTWYDAAVHGDRLAAPGVHPGIPIAHPTSAGRLFHGKLDTRSLLLSLAPHGDEGAGRKARLCRVLRTDAQEARCHGRRRRRSQIEELFEDRPPSGDAEGRRRAASLRLERLLLLPVPERAAPAYGAPLSRRDGAAVLA